MVQADGVEDIDPQTERAMGAPGANEDRLAVPRTSQNRRSI